MFNFNLKYEFFPLKPVSCSFLFFLTSGEIRGQLTNSETRVVVTSAQLIDKVQEAIAGTDIKIVVMGDTFGVIGDTAFHTLLADKGDLLTE